LSVSLPCGNPLLVAAALDRCCHTAAAGREENRAALKEQVEKVKAGEADPKSLP
jgi:hypothetical protein